MDDEGFVSDIVMEISASRNFREISPSLIRQVVLSERQPNESRKEMFKRVKSKLHQVANAFRGGSLKAQDLHDKIESINAFSTFDELKPLCRELMQSHASTKERIPILDNFYLQIFEQLPPIHSVLDLASGINPLAIPWMTLETGFTYHAIDLYQDMADILNAFFAKINVSGQAMVGNLLDQTPKPQADLTLLLKTIPVLEQVNKSAGKQILSRLTSPHAVVSFPIFSLSGKQKGMKTNYENHFMEICDPKQWQIRQLTFSNELVFILERK